MTKNALELFGGEPIKAVRIVPNKTGSWYDIQERWVKIKPNGEPEKEQGLSGEEISCDHRV